MRSRKSSCFVVAITLVTMALVGAGSAAAERTVLCKANEEHCSVENTWPLSPENFKGAILHEDPSETAELVMSGLFTVTCGGKLASSLEETEGPLIGEVEKWNFPNCTPKPCTLTVPKEFKTGYSAEVTATGGGDGILEVGLTPTLTATCPKEFTCTYSTSTMSFQVEGSPGESEEGHISSEATMTKQALKSSLGCPSTATYVSFYRTVEPGTPTFVTN